MKAYNVYPAMTVLVPKCFVIVIVVLYKKLVKVNMMVINKLHTCKVKA